MILSYNILISKHKNKVTFDYLQNQMYFSAKLYNQALTIKNEFYNCNIDLGKYELERLCRQIIPNNYYKQLKAKVAQCTIYKLDTNFKSYFQALKAYRLDKSKFNGMPRPPRYARKYRTIDFSYQAFSIKGNDLYVARNVKIHIDQIHNYKSLNVKYIDSKHLQLSLSYEVNELNEDLDLNNCLGIDLGIDNLMTTVSKDESFIINGKPIKALNQYFNKQLAKFRSERDLSKDYTFNKAKIEALSLNRRNLISNHFHHITKYIARFCVKRNIGKIVLGYNRGWKDSIKLGKKVNQKFISIPFYRLINILQYKCKKYGIELVIINEAYTSKCSSLDLEPIEKHDKYLGTRIFRGLFKSTTKVINADINGAINILCKYLGDNNFIKHLVHSKHIFTPIRLNVFDEFCNLQECNNKIIDSGICSTL